MILQNIPISNINVVDDSFRITYMPDLSELASSIQKVGILQPVTLRHTVEGTYQVVSGYKRILACQELNRQTIPALIHDASELSPQQAFIMNVHDNVFVRDLNMVEKFNVVSKLGRHYAITEGELVSQYLPLVGEGASYKILHQLLSIEALIEPMRAHMVDKGMAIANASRIAEFTPSTQGALIAILKPINPSANKLNELLILIREIAARDGASVENILARYQLLTIVADPNVASPDKVAALRQTLRSVRLPQLTERQRKLTELISNIQLPNSAKIVADPYFEDPNIKLECRFSAPEELDVIVKRIQSAFEQQQWQRLFDWYRI